MLIALTADKNFIRKKIAIIKEEAVL